MLELRDVEAAAQRLREIANETPVQMAVRTRLEKPKRSAYTA